MSHMNHMIDVAQIAAGRWQSCMVLLLHGLTWSSCIGKSPH